jgi:O-antigen/teichoic acid export membrane protein
VGAVVYGTSNFVLVVVLTSHLGAEGTGQLLLAIAAFNILVRVAELGASTGCIRLISRDLAAGREHEVPVVLRAAIGPVLLAGLVLGAATWLASSGISDLIAESGSREAVASHLRGIALFLPAAAVLSVSIQATRGFGTMRPQVAVDRVGKPLVQLGLVHVTLAAGYVGLRLDLAWAGPAALALVPTAVWLRRLVAGAVSGRAAPPVDRRAVAVEFWRFSAPRAVGQMFAVAVLWFDTLLIGALRSAEEAGIYAASTRYLLIGLFTAEAVMQVLGPNISRLLTRGEVARAESLFRTATAWQICLIWPVYLVTMLFAPVLLGVFGDEFRSASTVLVILSVGMLVMALLGAGDTVVLMAGRSRLSMRNGAVIFAINAGCNLLLTPRWGIEGAAVAWAAAIIASGALPALQVRSVSGIRPWGAPPRVAAIAAAGAVGIPAVLARVVVGPEPLGLALAVIGGGAAAVVVGWRLRRTLSLDELVRSLRGRRGAAA